MVANVLLPIHYVVADYFSSYCHVKSFNGFLLFAQDKPASMQAVI